MSSVLASPSDSAPAGVRITMSQQDWRSASCRQSRTHPFATPPSPSGRLQSSSAIFDRCPCLNPSSTSSPLALLPVSHFRIFLNPALALRGQFIVAMAVEPATLDLNYHATTGQSECVLTLDVLTSPCWADAVTLIETVAACVVPSVRQMSPSWFCRWLGSTRHPIIYTANERDLEPAMRSNWITVRSDN